MLDGQRLTIHRVGEQGLGLSNLIDGQTTFEANDLRTAVERAAVGSPQNYLARGWLDSSAIQDVDQRSAGPLRGTDRAEPPLLAVHWRVELPTTIASAFQA